MSTAMIDLTPEQIKSVVERFFDTASQSEWRRMVLYAFRRDDRRGFDTISVLSKLRRQLEREHCLPKGYIAREIDMGRAS